MEKNKEVEWHEVEDNDIGVTTMAYTKIDSNPFTCRTIGYNGMIIGDKVVYEDEVYTIVMVSRMGDFGLSTTGELPYSIRVSPSEVRKVE